MQWTPTSVSERVVSGEDDIAIGKLIMRAFEVGGPPATELEILIGGHNRTDEDRNIHQDAGELVHILK
jgi:hypothetical protein